MHDSTSMGKNLLPILPERPEAELEFRNKALASILKSGGCAQSAEWPGAEAFFGAAPVRRSERDNQPSALVDDLE
jgi:hypothetical protein